MSNHTVPVVFPDGHTLHCVYQGVMDQYLYPLFDDFNGLLDKVRSSDIFTNKEYCDCSGENVIVEGWIKAKACRVHKCLDLGINHSEDCLIPGAGGGV